MRPPSDAGEWVAAGVVALVAAVLLRALFEALAGFLAANWLIIPCLVAVAATAAAVVLRARSAARRARTARMAALRLSLTEVDALSPTGFELAVRDLMLRDGIAARHVGQRGDQAADVIGHDLNLDLVWVAQCKHTTTGARVGTRVVYEVSGTAGPIHGADLAFIATNGTFTRDAAKNAARLNIHLIDRDTLHLWATEGHSLHTLLNIRPLPLRLPTRPTGPPGSRTISSRPESQWAAPHSRLSQAPDLHGIAGEGRCEVAERDRPCRAARAPGGSASPRRRRRTTCPRCSRAGEAGRDL
ncbi:restriction endonuclease [Actinocorallia sp. API 0066]|uniref:restriction endonuclease n=1 Tax=Actinocorallia sp. API 0066 TaxID=2896846 RepID=UPI001E578607|nr:restriction endonuclease [Actinocorallia sp. API 0066]MCD0452340.1 restriction endonuclease [Actinocorallia sp. API 0066]